MKKSAMNGFTLMELMITVVIIGILAGIAYPSYTRYVAETRRSDATINLTRIATLQDKFFTRCGRYAVNLAVSGTPPNCADPGTLDAALGVGGVTREGHYTVTAVVAPGPGPLNAPGGGGFTLTAQPVGPQAIADAVRCNTFTIDQTGAKGAAGGDGLSGPNGGRCWKK
jgi:type IV pilus assembly protein PilE